ncbi:MAG: DNA polymerase III subunit delta [Bacteroidetes bacterium SW_9_63_38]|nr:MAG: DNA polymerase III subunit delta [Bacteroidetes bacterium SW_9_63_38]
MAKDTGPSYDDLATAFRHQNFDPLYFFFGEETFLIDELQELLIENALAPEQHDFNLDVLYGSETEASQVVGLCQGFPAGAPKRVVVVREFEKLENNRQFKDYVEQPNPQSIVLLACASKPNLSAHPYRALKEHATWSEFESPYDNEMPGWIEKYVSGQGYEIEPRATQMLADYVGTDLQRAASEIEKLMTFSGDRTRLTTDDVLAASGQTREFNVFELQAALGEGRHADAERIADRILQQASNPRGDAIMIVAVLNGYFDKLWKLQKPGALRKNKYDLAGEIGVSPYFVEEYKQAARRYDRASIADAYAALLAADYELKGGASREASLIVTLLLRRLLPPAVRPVLAE